jgi:hypothetical protein
MRLGLGVEIAFLERVIDLGSTLGMVNNIVVYILRSLCRLPAFLSYGISRYWTRAYIIITFLLLWVSHLGSMSVGITEFEAEQIRRRHSDDNKSLKHPQTPVSSSPPTWLPVDSVKRHCVSLMKCGLCTVLERDSIFWDGTNIWLKPEGQTELCR